MNHTASMSEKGGLLLLRYEQSLDCVHCGLCLPRCPTYEVTGNETESPRGRIYLMRAVAEGRLNLSTGFGDTMTNCLVCRACEQVCPSGVAFHQMMEITRNELSNKRLAGGRVKRWCIRHVAPSKRWVGALTGFIRLYRTLGLAWLLRKLRVAPRLQSLLPELPARDACRRLPALTRRTSGVSDRGSVVFFEGCVMPALMGDVNNATVAALADAGFDVHVPPNQTCCGALAAHSGDAKSTRALAAQNIAEIMPLMPNHVVVNAAGCSATMREYPLTMGEVPDQQRPAADIAAKTVDVMALLHRVGHVPAGPPKPIRAVYDEPCHLLNVGNDAADARRWIEAIPNVELLPMAGCDDCCGAAGIYNVTNPEMSDAILARKLDQLEATGAEVVLTGNIGCILQWRRGIAERGLRVGVLHPIVLAR